MLPMLTTSHQLPPTVCRCTAGVQSGIAASRGYLTARRHEAGVVRGRMMRDKKAFLFSSLATLCLDLFDSVYCI